MQRKERSRARKVVLQLLKERDCTLQELHNHAAENRLMYSPGLRTQINKMLLEYKLEVFKENLTYINIRGRNYPIVYCTEENDRWVFYCPFCQKRHYHSPMEGHRYAHCGFEGDSIFRPYGYYLKLEDKK